MVGVGIIDILVKGVFLDCAMNTAFVNRKIPPQHGSMKFEIDHTTLSGMPALDAKSEE